MKKQKENKDEKPWDVVNRHAKEKFGEFGISTCKDDQVAQLIDLKEADKMAEDQYGEFGFGALDTDQQEELINGNPTILKVK